MSKKEKKLKERRIYSEFVREMLESADAKKT